MRRISPLNMTASLRRAPKSKRVMMVTLRLTAPWKILQLTTTSPTSDLTSTRTTKLSPRRVTVRAAPGAAEIVIRDLLHSLMSKPVWMIFPIRRPRKR